MLKYQLLFAFISIFSHWRLFALKSYLAIVWPHWYIL